MNLTMDAAGRSLLTAECEASDQMFRMKQDLQQFELETTVKESQINKLLQEKKETADSLYEKDTLILALQSQLASLHGNQSQSEAYKVRLHEQVQVLSEAAKIDGGKIKELEQHLAMQSKMIAEMKVCKIKCIAHDGCWWDKTIQLKYYLTRRIDIRIQCLHHWKTCAQ